MSERYGSDVVVEGLLDIGIDRVAINPGASIRGLHDSLTLSPAMSLVETLNEGVAVAIAHGYAKSTGSMMAVALHDLVGLQAAAMAVYNAWADMTPMLLLGGWGPGRHGDRRPWIDWIHTAKPQSLVVREYVKWDDQPISPASIPESLARAHYLASLAPEGPVYLSLDVGIQEAPVGDMASTVPVPGRRSKAAPDPATIERTVDILKGAGRPLIVADYLGRSAEAFQLLQEFATATAAPVVDLGARLNIPTRHPNDASLAPKSVLSAADVVLALDVRDLAWACEATFGIPRSELNPDVKVISVGQSDLMKSSFVDLERFTHTDIRVVAESGETLRSMLEAMGGSAPRAETSRWLSEITTHQAHVVETVPSFDALTVECVIAESARLLEGVPLQIAHVGPGSFQKHKWVRRYFELEEFAGHLGNSGGGGLGYGIGASVGAGLGQLKTGRIVINFQTDGDALHSASGLWTAAHHRAPVLFLILNNRGYDRERRHQRDIAAERGRPTERSTIGTEISDPDIRFVELAEGHGIAGLGPAGTVEEFRDCMKVAIKTITSERVPVLVEAIVE